MAKNILVTGGCGFIGSHFVRYLLQIDSDCTIFNLDNLSYAGDLARLKDIEHNSRYRFIKADLRKIEDIEEIFSHNIDIVVHLAAESHVDNSIKDPYVFEEVNVRGTLNLLSCARKHRVKRFIHVSTDEVYGEIEEGKFTENSPFAPNSPYSASKAAADFFVRAYMRTYGFPAIIIRPSNNYGPWQYPEKFIPVAISSVLADKKIPVYAQGLNCREWLYVGDCAEGVSLIMEKGKIGEIYNLGSGREMRNIDLAREILKIMGKPEDFIDFVEDRPGHDFRYCLDSSKVNKLDWEPQVDFATGIKDTVQWYTNKRSWIEEKLGL